MAQRSALALRAAAVATAAALVFSACAGQDEASFASVDELASGYVEAGGSCLDLQRQYQVAADDADVVVCGADTVLTFAHSEEQTAEVATGAMLRGHTVILGERWVVQDPDVEALQPSMGGSIVELAEGPQPTGLTAGAFVFGSGQPRIEVVVDAVCDYCATFFAESGEYLEELADSGQATVEYRIVALHDAPGNGFGSSYAANALACAYEADETAFRPLLADVLADAPADGWSTDSLTALVGEHGVDTDECVAEGEFLYWAMNSTRGLLADGLPSGDNLGGVPYITINGAPYAQNVADGQLFRDAVEAS